MQATTTKAPFQNITTDKLNDVAYNLQAWLKKPSPRMHPGWQVEGSSHLARAKYRAIRAELDRRHTARLARLQAA